MKRVFAIALTLCLLFVAGAAVAQTPYIMVYYDNFYTIGNKDCPSGPPGTILDSVFVVAQQFNRWFVSVEYSINYPTQMSYFFEIPTSTLHLGNTVDGIAQTWSFPVSGYEPALLNKVYFFWNCDGCVVSNIPVVVANHPQTFQLGGVQFQTLEYFSVTGMTSLVCGTTPVEDTTWGNIKALYEQ